MQTQKDKDAETLAEVGHTSTLSFTDLTKEILLGRTLQFLYLMIIFQTLRESHGIFENCQIQSQVELKLERQQRILSGECGGGVTGMSAVSSSLERPEPAG